MRRSTSFSSVALLIFAWGALCAAQSPTLQDVKTVYFWPMSHSLDQYIAEQLSAGGPFQVVVDPKMADAIITQRIDAPFLKAMDELAASQAPAKAETEAVDASKTEGSIGGAVEPPRPANRPLGRPEGTVFLVHVPSRKVLWSTFITQKDFSPKNLHQQARDIADRLKKEAGPKE